MRCLCILLACLTIASTQAAGLIGPDGKPVVVRGIGWSPWHATEHWNHSEATRQIDRRLLHEAHINTLRHWGPDKPESVTASLAEGFLVIPTIHCHEGLAAEFPDGSPHGKALSDPETRDAFARRVEEHTSLFRDTKGPLCFLLGNEYTAVGYHKAIDNYQYNGFEPSTQARFQDWLKERFGSVEEFNRHSGTAVAAFDQVKPLENARTRYEWWLFNNRAFESFMRQAHDAAKRGAPSIPTSYAKLMGTHWDPYTEDARLSFLDVGGSNLYWNWVHDWARYNGFINDLIAAAQGRPVLITEGGFRSRVEGEEQSGRLTKQMLWNALLHPEVAGFCVYAYSDEWYVDGNPAEQTNEESWGIVTADRRPKPSYFAVAEVYQILEEMNDFFASCQAPPVVAVSNQAMGYNVERKSTELHDEIARVLYSDGVSFSSLMPEDVRHLDPARTPRVIFCDELFDCEPDGSRSAMDSFLAYIRAGGKALYLCPEPWRLVYGEAGVPEDLRFDLSATGIARTQYGEGAVWFLPRNEFEPGELRGVVSRFLEETGAESALRVTAVAPPESRADVFVRLLSSGSRQILLAVNAGDAAVESVDIQLPGAPSPRLLYSDGARLGDAGSTAGGVGLRLTGLNTYALVEISRSP